MVMDARKALGSTTTEGKGVVKGEHHAPERQGPACWSLLVVDRSQARYCSPGALKKLFKGIISFTIG